MLDLIQKGGILMYPIIFLSILSLAFFLERLYSLRIKKYISPVFSDKLRDLLKNNDYDVAEALCAQRECSLGRIAFDILSNRQDSWAQLYSIAENAGRREADSISKYQETMVNIVALAPLLGLLGTILGMIKIFGVLSVGGVGDAQALSGGIAEALLTTAAGLCVAIPAQVFYQIIKHRADFIIKELENETATLVNMISKNNGDK